MRQHRPRRTTTILVALVSPLAMLTLVALGGADGAAATPAAGYTASLIPIGPETYSVAVNSATDTVYFGERAENELTVVDGATNTVESTIALPVPPIGIAVDSVTNTVYVALEADTYLIAPSIEVINGATNTMTNNIPLPSGSGVTGIAADSSTDTVYAAEANVGAVAVISGSSNSVTATVSTGSGTGPVSLAVDEATNVVWAADVTGDVQAISGATNMVTRTFNLGPNLLESVGVNPLTNTVYVATDAGVAVINAATGTTRSPLSGTHSDGVTVDPDTGTVFASNYDGGAGTGTTFVIDGSSNTVVDTIPRGGLGIAVNTTTGAAYVAAFDAQPTAAWVLTPSAANAWSPVITGTSATLDVGTASSFPIPASALPAATYSETGALPAGITLSTSGVLSGTPPAGSGGTYPITITASNGVPPDYSRPFNVVVDEAPIITSASRVTFVTGSAGRFTATATGFPAPAFFSESGALPVGVTFGSSGRLFGTPVAGTAGIYPITITASNGVAPDDSQAFTLTVDEPPPTLAAAAVGVEGTDGQLWAQAPQLGAGWQPLGGVIIAPPAVAAVPNPDGTTPADPVFIATGTDGSLWIRSITAGWQPVGAARCIGGPAAVVTGTPAAGYTLTVACRGTDNALWYTTTTVPSSGLPAFTGPWTSLGGVLSAAPAVAPVGTTVTFFVRGTSGAIYTRTVAADYAVTTWSCTGQPAAALQAATGTTTFACNAGGALWESADSGSGWSPAVSLGGALIGGPAVAATSQQTDFLAEGTDHAVWQLSPAGWSSLGGSVVGGVGGAALN